MSSVPATSRTAWARSYAGRRRRRLEAPPRSERKGGSAAGAAKTERVRTLGVIGVPPTHDGLGMAPGARGHARGARALRDVVEGEGSLARAWGALRATWRRSSAVPPQRV